MSRMARSPRRSPAAAGLNKQMVQDLCLVVMCFCYLTFQLVHKGLPLVTVWKDVSQQPVLLTPTQHQGSPLKEIVEKLSPNPLSQEERQVLEDMNRLSDLELEMVAIAETVMPAGEHGKLVEYVEKNLAGVRGLLGAERADAVVSMVRDYSCCEDFVGLSNGALDSTGSLSSYASLVLVTQEEGYLHFMLTAVKAEPHLGWRGISRGKRSQWKSALAKSLTEKVIADAKRNFAS